MARQTASIVKLWYRMMGIGKAGTSGMDNQFSFNGKVDSVQKALVELLIDIDEENTKVTDALNWLKVSSGNINSDNTGLVTLPDDYLHLIAVKFGVGGKYYTGNKLRGNEIAMTATSPIRGDNTTTNEYNYYFKGNNLYTETVSIAVKLDYHKEVPAASITLTPTSDTTGDYLVPAVGAEFGWPTSMQNLLLYLVLEQYGVEVKENLLVEYAQLGISREMIKTTAK